MGGTDTNLSRYITAVDTRYYNPGRCIKLGHNFQNVVHCKWCGISVYQASLAESE